MADPEDDYESAQPESQDASEMENEEFDAEKEHRNTMLLRLVRTAAGQDLFVNSVAQSAMGLGNWGGLLSAAPDALGRLGQCFVLASDPLAATLTIPESAGLPYKSLRANLVECSDLGRKAFRDAEIKMKKVSTIACTICEPGGTIDMIIEAVEDDDLAELDLPEQLEALKRFSSACIHDTQGIKAKVDDWGKFAKSIHKACIDKDDDLGNKKLDLGDQIEVKGSAVKMKQAVVTASEEQTANYRKQVAGSQEEYKKAEKAHSRGGWEDFGFSVGETVLSSIKSYINPLSAINLSFGSSQQDGGGGEGSYTQADPQEQDPGIALADLLLPIIHRLAELLTYGPLELAGVDWESLAGRVDSQSSINHLVHAIRDVHNQFSRQQTSTSRQISIAAKSGEETALEIQNVARDERSLGTNTGKIIAERGPVWRKQVTASESQIADLVATALREAKEEEAKRQEQNNKNSGRSGMSRAEIRFRRFQQAQQALFDAERRLNTRLEEDLKMTQEFNAMQLELEKLLRSKATMTQVKEIVGECVSHLHYFCEKLDHLASFFGMLQAYIEDMDKSRVDPFTTMSNTTKKLSERAKAETSESLKLRKEKIKQKKLDELRLKALELKGYYLVAKAMADTYVEVSADYIIPGVNRVERLSLPEAKSLTQQERASKVAEVADLAKTAKDKVVQLANQRKKEMIRAMTDNRGEIEEMKELESNEGNGTEEAAS